MKFKDDRFMPSTDPAKVDWQAHPFVIGRTENDGKIRVIKTEPHINKAMSTVRNLNADGGTKYRMYRTCDVIAKSHWVSGHERRNPGKRESDDA